MVVGDLIRGHYLRMGSMSSSAPMLTTQASLTTPRRSSSASVTSIKRSRRTSQSARTSRLLTTATSTRQVRHASDSRYFLVLPRPSLVSLVSLVPRPLPLPQRVTRNASSSCTMPVHSAATSIVLFSQLQSSLSCHTSSCNSARISTTAAVPASAV